MSDHPNITQPWDDWLREHERSTRAKRLSSPGWAFDRVFVNTLAESVLPRLCRELGLGPFVSLMPRPAWWPFKAPIPGPDDVILTLRAHQHGRSALFMLDQSTGEWVVNGPPIIRAGADMIEAAAWLWGGSESRAAHRITRMAGRDAPWAA